MSSLQQFLIIVICLFLAIESAHGGSVAVNSTADTDVRDTSVTLREAIMISEGELAVSDLTPSEMEQLALPVGSDIADTIRFDVAGTISPTHALPIVRDHGTVLDASSQWTGVWPGGQPGITLDGSGAGDADGLVISGALNCRIYGLFITRFRRTGVVIQAGAQTNSVGGFGRGKRNVISGNGQHGVWIGQLETNGNQVAGNYIGTDVTGMVTLGNSWNGVFIGEGACANIIGGSTIRHRNVISGNNGHGLVIQDAGTNGNQVMANYIGVATDGTTGMANWLVGVGIYWGAQANVVGGKKPAERNILSTHELYGVQIFGTGTDGNIVYGNYIGTDASGEGKAGNGCGVAIHSGAQLNTIGPENIIAFNADRGVFIDHANSDFNTITQNSIHSNDGIGIDLTGGGNHEIAAPALMSTNLLGSTLTLSGDSAGAGATVEIFGADSVGEGEGQIYLGSLVSDSTGHFTGRIDIQNEVLNIGDPLVVTTTHPNRRTSEFSIAAPVQGVTLTIYTDKLIYHRGDPMTVSADIVSQLDSTADNASLALYLVSLHRTVLVRRLPLEIPPDSQINDLLVLEQAALPPLRHTTYAYLGVLSSQSRGILAYDVAVWCFSNPLSHIQANHLKGIAEEYVRALMGENTPVNYAETQHASRHHAPLAEDAARPAETRLHQNVPNPLNPETWIPYQLATGADVKLWIYDCTGRTVRMLDIGYRDPGYYLSADRSAHWDGTNQVGEPVTSGMYFYRLEAGDFSAIRKMILVR